MEKRLILFLVLSMAVTTGYLALQQSLRGPLPVVEGQDGEDPAKQPGADDPGPGKDGAAKADGAKGDGAKDDGAKDDGAKDDGGKDDGPGVDPPDVGPAPPQIPDAPASWVAFGNYQAGASPLMVVAVSRGGGIHRLELVERQGGRLRYRDLSAPRGYLGAVADRTDSLGGAQVLAVLDGSPAAEAGLLAEDVIVAVDDDTVLSAAHLRAALQQHKSGATVKVTVRRGAANQTFGVKLTRPPLSLIRPELDGDGVPTGAPASFTLELQSINGVDVDPENPLHAPLANLATRNWETKRLPDGVEFRQALPPGALQPFGVDGGLELVKRFRLAADDAGPGGYLLQYQVELRNPGGDPLAVQLRMYGPNGLTTEGWWYQNKIHPRMFKSAGARDVICRTVADGRMFRGAAEIYARKKKQPRSPLEPFFAGNDVADERTVLFAAVDTQYFTVALLPEDPGPDGAFEVAEMSPLMHGSPDDVQKIRMKTVNTSFMMITNPLQVDAAGTLGQTFSIYAGPKQPGLLEDYALSDTVEYGWFPYIAKPLAGILHLLYAVVRNYGLAIILLTVLVRGLMLPLGRKAARNAQMMQELAPEINKIKEKYKGDMQKQAEAQRGLYAKHNFNPLSGCLPMLVQLPIFLGLYRALSVDIELRQAALIPGADWCSNLAGPDQLLNWQSFMPAFLTSETGWLGPYLNILPIATIILFLVQQKMFTPPAMDDQQRMSQQIMTFMMVFVGILFFKVPAGLCIYFITSSLWGIGERKLLPPAKLNGAAAGAGGGGGGATNAAPKMEPSKAAVEARERAKRRRKKR